MNIPKGVAIVLGILIILSIILITNKNEGFTVVENNVDKIITIQDGSLLDKINQKDEVVKNIWGCSEFGKEMKLC
jgi:fumarylacetoacetate (FAA) hydrolase family protein